MNWSRSKTVTTFVAGLTVGLVFGGGVLVGVRHAGWLGQPSSGVPETLLKASATHGTDTMAMATGPIANGVEGVFFLDFVTGDLTCTVIEPRTLRPGGVYKHNVATDLGVLASKQPKYLLATGAADIRTAMTSNTKFAQSLVYVCDANTGRWVAYGLPWNNVMANVGATQVGQLFKLGGGVARADVIRE